MRYKWLRSTSCTSSIKTGTGRSAVRSSERSTNSVMIHDMSWSLTFALALQAVPGYRSLEAKTERTCYWSGDDLKCSAKFRSGEDDMEEVVFSMSDMYSFFNWLQNKWCNLELTKCRLTNPPASYISIEPRVGVHLSQKRILCMWIEKSCILALFRCTAYL